jgi:sulfite reductase beta subunit-like hemoprotein/nitrite reductase/ring-hydroxylating ferredoxin subunit
VNSSFHRIGSSEDEFDGWKPHAIFQFKASLYRRGMAAPDIPGIKRAGLPVDFDRLAAEGDDWLTPEDRFALKTWGVCAQAQDHMFMVRVRVPGGALLTEQARGLARLCRQYSEKDWLHCTTRQNVEIHWVLDRKVPELLEKIGHLGLTTRSACGHTMRNVMVSEDAGLSLDEPFDCLPHARIVSDAIVARAATLNPLMPSRINLAFGGSARCRTDARVNDGGFVSVVRDGEPGFELWGGGSLGKAPFLAVLLVDFIPAAEVLPAAEAIFDVFITEGDIDTPAKGRLKFVVGRIGEDAFRAAFEAAFEHAKKRQASDAPRPTAEVASDGDWTEILSVVPPGGWSIGVRPQREPGRVLCTVEAPLGDLRTSDFELLSDLADRFCDGALNISRDQNVVLRNVAVSGIVEIRERLRERGLFLLGEAHRAQIRACTGSAVCALGVTTAPDAGTSLLESPSLGRNSALRVHISGCPNSCAQHQIGDIGLSGAKVKLGGKVRDGYQVFLGADLEGSRLGEVAGRVADEDVPAAVDAIVGTWEALRQHGETLGQTVNRIGRDAFGAHIGALMEERWAPGPEPEETAADIDGAATVPPRLVAYAPGQAPPGERTNGLGNSEGDVALVPLTEDGYGWFLDRGRYRVVASAPAAAVGVSPTTTPAAAGSSAPMVAVAALADLAPESVRTVEVGGCRLALIHTGGRVCAVADRCPHSNASLGEGAVVEEFAIECPLHGAVFDVRTGEPLEGPTDESVATYEVSVEAGVVSVRV